MRPRPYKPAEDAALRDGAAKAMTFGQIGQLLNRTTRSVKARAAILGVTLRRCISRDPAYQKLRYRNGYDRVSAVMALKSEGKA